MESAFCVNSFLFPTSNTNELRIPFVLEMCYVQGFMLLYPAVSKDVPPWEALQLR